MGRFSGTLQLGGGAALFGLTASRGGLGVSAAPPREPRPQAASAGLAGDGQSLAGPRQAAAPWPWDASCRKSQPLCPRAVLPCGGGLSFGSSLKIACHHRKMSPSTSSILCRLCWYTLETCPCVNSRAERSLTRGRVLVRQSAAVSSGEKSLFGSEASPAAGGGSGDGRQRLRGSRLLFLPASLWAGAGCPGRAHVVPFRCQPHQCRPFLALVR